MARGVVCANVRTEGWETGRLGGGKSGNSRRREMSTRMHTASVDTADKAGDSVAKDRALSDGKHTNIEGRKRETLSYIAG